VTLKYAKNAFAAGTQPRTPLGELTTLPPDTLVGPNPLGACGASTLAPSALASWRPPTGFLTNRTLLWWHI